MKEDVKQQTKESGSVKAFTLGKAAIFLLVMCLMGLCVTSTGQAAVFSCDEDFEGTALDDSFVDVSIEESSATVVDGALLMEKNSGVLLGNARIKTTFEILGDFTITVDANRIQTNGLVEMGISTLHDTGYADVYFIDTNRIASYGTLPGFRFRDVNNSSAEVTFRIRRVGNTMYEEFDAGSGFQSVQTVTGTGLQGPVIVSLFLLQRFHPDYDNSGTFDNLTIVADDFEICTN